MAAATTAIANSPRIDREIERFSGAPLTPGERRDVTIADRALTIYTSGTTGLPKAAKVSHRRLMQWSLWFGALMNATPDDRMYDCLPMYHSVGGVVAIGALLTRGGSVVIREKFSVREFWDDVARWNCTLFQYIGELCRYLVQAPPHPRERAHRLRLACGNGLRADVWRKFQSRFDGAADFGILCRDRRQRVALQRRGQNRRGRPRAAVLDAPLSAGAGQVRPAAAVPERDAAGRCIRCAPEETGEAIGRIANAAKSATASGEFEGYTSAAETERKILRDVFEPGDAWFRTGDLMRMDASGFFYFVDRIGDTFRWKGENVSASEVAAALAEFPGVSAATVYGVAVPGAEGKAGMAAIATDGALDLAGLRAHLAPPAAGLCATHFFAAQRPHRRDGDLQTQKRRAGARRIRSHGRARSALCRRSAATGFRAARRRARRPYRERQDPLLAAILKNISSSLRHFSRPREIRG